MIPRPLFDAPQAGEFPEAERRADALRPDTLRTSRRTADSHPQGRSKAKDSRRLLTVASTVAALLCFPATALAEPLSLTTLRRAALEDPSDGIGSIMKDVWAQQIADAQGSFSFGYAIFKTGDKQYLVSSFRSGSACRPSECEWAVQRLTAAYKVVSAGKPFVSCGEINKLDLTAGKLTICGKEAVLP